MRTSRMLFRALIFAAASLASLCTAMAGDDQFNQLARKVVTVSANIKPGDVVMISGGKHTLPLMESLAIEARKAGGMVTILINTDRIARSFNVDVPEQYLDQQPRYFAEWLKHVDVYIGLPQIEDTKAVIASVPEARFVKGAKAGQVIQDTLNTLHIRAIFIGYPTRADADANKLDFASYEKMQWDAVNADYAQISDRAKTLQSRLRGAKAVHLTSPAGTDLTFSIGDRPIFVDDGIVTQEKAKSNLFMNRTASLPGGQVFVAPIETSANGKVMVRKDQCRSDPVTEESFEFRNGTITNYTAKEGADCAKQSINAAPGADQFSYFAIGLNPALKVIEDGGDFRPDHGAGVVTISTGNNQLLGGNNHSPDGFGFPVINATVEVDGQTVVRDGRLTF
jgi:aminopeptidase